MARMCSKYHECVSPVFHTGGRPMPPWRVTTAWHIHTRKVWYLTIGVLTAIHKKGSKSCPCNYHPISRILKNLFREHIFEHLGTHDLISQSQHSFVPKKSCISNLLNCLDEWTKAWDEGYCVDVMLGGVAVGRGFEPQSDLELSFAEILI
jgi:hypothetical protein